MVRISHGLVSQVTYCQLSDLDFVEGVVQQIVAKTSESHKGGKLSLQGYLPPFDGVPPAGYLELWLDKDGATPVAFGICMDPGSIRTELAVSFRPTECFSAIDADINLHTFDEIWYLVCRTASLLEVSSVELLYGC